MKATIDLPDDLYRRAKARSAMEGRPFRSVAVELIQDWLDAPASLPGEPNTPGLTTAERKQAPWLAITQPYVKPGMSHDMEDIRAAIARGSAAETAEKLAANDS